MKIESKIGKSAYNDLQIYSFITDFNNFKDLIPEGKVTGWESSEDECSFNVDPLGRTGLRVIEKIFQLPVYYLDPAKEDGGE